VSEDESMSSETREIAHDQHTHPGRGFYWMIGAVLIGLTVLEVLAYVGEVNELYAPGIAAVLIGALSAMKFVAVVAFYMHLKFDHKLFTGIFVFPAILGTLVITAMWFLFQLLPELTSRVG
jgi:cytochrome c oxidase subunit 4